MKFIKLFESFKDELYELKNKYPMADITMTPHERFNGSYFARVDIIKQDGGKEYLGALKGPVSKEKLGAIYPMLNGSGGIHVRLVHSGDPFR